MTSKTHGMPPSTTASKIGSLLNDWSYTSCDDESDPDVRWYVVATFDHDYEFHLLVMQWRSNGTTFDNAGYSLWFVTSDGSPVFCYEWPTTAKPPLVHASAYVLGWMNLDDL